MSYRLRFDGVNDIVTLPSSCSVNWGTDTYTIEFGIVATRFPATGLEYFIGNNGPTATGIALRQASGNGALAVVAGGNFRFASAPGLVILNEYHVYRLEHDAGGAVRWYRNGVLFGGPYSPFTTSVTATFGAFGRGSTSGVFVPFDLGYVAVTGFTNSQKWDAALSNGIGSILPTESGANQGTLVGFHTDDSEWIPVGIAPVIQQESSGGTLACISTAIAQSARANRQQVSASATATANNTVNAATSIKNSQQQQTSGSASQSVAAIATTSPLNKQQHQTTGTAAQTNQASAQAQAKNSQHKQSTGQVASVARFIASTSWVNTVYMGNVQNLQTSGSASQSLTAIANSLPLNGQHHQTTGTAAQTNRATAQAQAKNSQHKQSSGQVVSVARFIASTSWVNTVSISNVQNRQTSGSATQVVSDSAQATPTNSQRQQTAGQASAAARFVATTSWINTVLQIAAYTRHIKTQSITRKNFKTSTRHSYHIKSRSNQ